MGLHETLILVYVRRTFGKNFCKKYVNRLMQLKTFPKSEVNVFCGNVFYIVLVQYSMWST